MEKLDIELHGYGTQTVFLELKDTEGTPLEVDEGRLKLWVKPPFQNTVYPELSANPADPAAGLSEHLKITFGSGLLAGTHWREARWALDLADENGAFKTLVGGTVYRSF